MSNNKTPSFFEPRTIIAFALTMVVFVLWQNHMKTKYPQIYSHKKAKVESTENISGNSAENAREAADQTTTVKAEEKPLLSKPDASAQKPVEYVAETKTFDAQKWSAIVSSSGFQFNEIELKDYKDRKSGNITFTNIFKTTFFGMSEPIPFVLNKTSENSIQGVFKNEKGSIEKTLKFNPSNYSVDVSYKIEGEFPGVSIFFDIPVNENAKGSLLFPTFEKQEFVVLSSDGEDRDSITAKDFATRSFNQVKLLSLGSQFFSNAIVDNSSLKPNALVFANQSDKTVTARLDYEFSKELKSFHIAQTYFAGPKDDVILKSVDKEMIRLINFGMFKVICEPILFVLKFFYSIFYNYGVAIILLTLLMRMLVFPIAYRGYKSMDKMQKIQPHLKAIREKHKEDSQKANLETMALMKEHKVNPVGGCLPMLLQLPIFFAFYRVLSESIVMYQSPFMLWITDLSLKDPYYVLPVLMGLTMFIQQKLTPTALEPMQQRVMLFMPLIFSVFMISLPSALTLYIFVSTLFGVLQQYLFTKSKSASAVKLKGV
jgi:YidC/Oxa1 family membrane protein insertase